MMITDLIVGGKESWGWENPFGFPTPLQSTIIGPTELTLHVTLLAQVLRPCPVIALFGNGSRTAHINQTERVLITVALVTRHARRGVVGCRWIPNTTGAHHLNTVGVSSENADA